MRQAAKIAAFEAARVALVPGATESSLSDQCDIILASRNMIDYTISANATLSAVNPGDLFTVTVDIPYEPNAILTPFFLRGQSITESVTVMIEDNS